MHILVLNSGSSSIKYQLFRMRGEQVLARGLIANIHPEGDIKNHEQGLDAVFRALESAGIDANSRRLDAVGHRVVHGGPSFNAPAVIDDAVCAAVERHVLLAPLHNPPNLAGIRAARRRLPGIPQVAVFDTAFHRDMPAVAATYALPRALADAHHIHRYGFHGTNCAWCLSAAAVHIERPPGSLNVIVAHLGAGASVTAIRAGRSVDTSMGMSPLEGLMMQTRCGDIDPAIPLHLLRSGMSVAEVDQLLNFRSGVKGICGEADMETVASRSAAGDPDSVLARDMFCYRIQKYIGAYAGVVWPLDVLVFTAGIGENDAWVRGRICAGLRHLGIELDEALNQKRDAKGVRSIRRGASGAEILVVPANEELQIARETAAAIRRGPSSAGAGA